jgi:chromosome segregation ATPase
MSRLASKESHSESVLNEIKREYEERVRRVLEEREEREREIEGELRKYTEVCSELRLSLSDSQLFVEQRTSETTKLKDANSILDHELNASKLHQADLKKQTAEKEGEISRLKTELEKIEVSLKNTETEKVK